MDLDDDDEDDEKNASNNAVFLAHSCGKIYTQVMPDLRKMFTVGQLVRCVIVELTDASDETHGKKRIELSVKPQLVNANIDVALLVPGLTLQGAVQSSEDHGYIIDLGIPAMTGFLLKKHVASELKAGQLIDCVVLKAPSKAQSARTVSLTIDPSAAQKPLVTNKNLALASLQPGMLVNVSVQNVYANGLWVKFLDYFEGSIDWLHASRAIEGDAPVLDLSTAFVKDQKVPNLLIFLMTFK
jgi:rRNA biogenesis protein RRP5